MEKLYQLNTGDIFVVSTNIFLNTNWDSNKFNFIQQIYYPKPWWKFWEKRKLKSVTIMYIGERK